jgi:hypothetical protein
MQVGEEVFVRSCVDLHAGASVLLFGVVLFRQNLMSVLLCLARCVAPACG